MGNREQKALVTGYKGFIGSHIYDKVGGIGIDIKDGNDIRTCELPEKCDIIYHTAARASIPESFKNPLISHDHNVTGTLRLLEYARKTGAKLIFSSSSSVKEMMSPYAIQKKQCEEYMRWYWKQGVKCVALRYYNVFGERQEIANGGNQLALAQILTMYYNKEPWSIVEGGNRKRDFVYVGDVVKANTMAAEWLDEAKEFMAFEVGTGENYAIKEITEWLDPHREVISLPPREEPIETKSNPNNFLPKWTPTITIEKWLRSTLMAI